MLSVLYLIVSPLVLPYVQRRNVADRRPHGSPELCHRCEFGENVLH